MPLAEVARRFGLTPAEVATDLELAAMCGLPPFVDEMIDVFIDDDTVFVGVPRLFTRPLRLTAPEGFALVAAGRAAMQLPGAEPDGPLGRGLQKLAAALGDDAVVVDLPVTPALASAIETVTAAVGAGERLRIEYWTASRDEVTSARSRRGGCSTTAASGTSSPTTVARASGARSASTASSRSSATGEHDAVEPIDARRGAGLVRRRRAAAGDAAPAAGGPLGRRALPGRRRQGAPRRRASTRRSRWPASGGWSGCSCGSGRTPRCGRRPRGGASAADVAGRVLDPLRRRPQRRVERRRGRPRRARRGRRAGGGGRRRWPWRRPRASWWRSRATS